MSKVNLLSDKKKEDFFLLLKMANFQDNETDTIRGEGGKSLIYSLGSMMYQTGAKASFQANSKVAKLHRDLLIDYIPEVCIAYVKGNVFQLSVITTEWGPDNSLIQSESVLPFLNVGSLLYYVQQLQKLSHERVLQAFNNCKQQLAQVS